MILFDPGLNTDAFMASSQNTTTRVEVHEHLQYFDNYIGLKSTQMNS